MSNAVLETIAAAENQGAVRASIEDLLQATEDRQDRMLSELETKVQQMSAAKRDASADTRSLLAAVVENSDIPLAERVVITVPNPSTGGMVLAPNDVAHDQIADRVGIPRQYYRRMLNGQPALLAENLNVWLQQEPDVRLIRCLAPITEEDRANLAKRGAHFKMRAMLGKSYRMIDDAEILASILPIAREYGAKLTEYSHDERRLHAKFVTRERSIDEIRNAVAARNGDARVPSSFIQEVLRSGLYVRNSETGFAMLDVATYIEMLVCLNGMIRPSSLKARHVGKRREADENPSWLSATTQALDNAAVMSRAQDAARAALDDVAILEAGKAIEAAKTDVVDLKQPVFEWIDGAAASLSLNEAQAALLKEETTFSIHQERQRVQGLEGISKFALVQGLTAVARQTEDADRKAELQATGWNWLESSASDLVKLGQSKRGRNN